MKINWGYIKSFAVIILVLFFYGFSNYRNLNQKVRSVDIKFEQGDNLFMSYEMVNKLLIQNNGKLQNKSKSLIDLNSLENQILAHPMVENAMAYLTVDAELKMVVKQRIPIGRISEGSKSYYIDRLGSKMPLSKKYSARVPIVTGVNVFDNTNDLFYLLSVISTDDFLNKQIVGVHRSGLNEYKLLTRVGAKEIIIGSVDNLNEKFKNLKSFYLYAMNDNVIDNYKEINLKYNNQVVCTKK